VKDDKKPDAPAGAPEKYTDFKLPEGIKLEGDQLTAATTLFKESGLSQDAAQKMVDFHVAQLKATAEAPLAAYQAQREAWQTAAKADPEIGPKLAAVKETLGRAYDSLGDPALVAEFKAAMDLTGVGDNPAFIKAFYRFAQRVTEGKHVAGGGPSPHGQRAPGASAVPTPAQALYPNLPSSGPQRG
jgi:hypothetical protein